MDAALLFVRLVVGLSLAAHGAQKFGLFGGYGLAATGGFFENLGFRPGRIFALFAGLGEVGGGLLTALGLFGALGPATIVMVMLVAIFSVHISKGFFVTNGVGAQHRLRRGSRGYRVCRKRCILTRQRAGLDVLELAAVGIDIHGCRDRPCRAQSAGSAPGSATVIELVRRRRPLPRSRRSPESTSADRTTRFR